MPDAADPNKQLPLVLGLRHLAQHLARIVETALVPAGITLRHFGLLITIHANPGQNQREIGEMLHIDRTTVVTLADELELAGLIERRRGADRRSFALHLTRAGVARTMQLQAMVEQVHGQFLATLQARERAMFYRIITQLVEATTSIDSKQGTR